MDEIYSGLDESYPVQGRLLAFDFGLRYLGIAVGQSITCTATPLTILQAREGEPDWPEISALIEQWHPVALVVGLPIDMRDQTTEITLEARRFAIALKQKFHLPVFGVDERLTSDAAKERLKDAGVYKKNPRQRLDAVSAQIILESWLNQYCRC